MPNSKRAVALISGRGSNLKALLEEAVPENTAHFRIDCVISDQDAPGLEYARAHSVPTKTFLRGDFESKQAHRSAIFSAVRALEADFVLLAGFMMIVPEEFTREFFGKLINIHPSLLPKFPGLHTHERAIEAGETIHGCSTHFVDDGVDTGPLIAQAECAVLIGDTPDTLATRLLPIEHELYPWTVNQLASGNIALENGVVTYSATALKSAKQRGFRTFGTSLPN